VYPEVRAGFGVFMSEALELAAHARGRTSPNPMVGAVIVRRGQVLGRGYHHRAGQPHAEVLALHEAGDLARGATLVLNLEPCSHFGRTPPCAPAVVEAGVAEVVVAMEDPNPVVAGSGLQLLRESGVTVQAGLMEAEARQLNEAFIKRVTTGLPFVELKVAMTLDGKIATSSGHSRWVTGDVARAWVHQRRDQADAILVGAGTVRADDPQLTVRPAPPDGRQPLRCVVSASGELPEECNLLTDGAAETVVFMGVGSQEPGVGSREPRARSREPGAGSRESGARSRELGVGSREPGVGSREPRAGAPAAPPGDSSLDAQNDKPKGARNDIAEAAKNDNPKWIVLEADDNGSLLEPALRYLANHGINDVLVEGGAYLNASLLRAGLVDRVSAFVAPKLFGGSGPSGFGDLSVCDPSGAIRLEQLTVEQIGEDWLFRGRPCSPA
jgi:riboflavin biosynthesis protein RibD